MKSRLPWVILLMSLLLTSSAVVSRPHAKPIDSNELKNLKKSAELKKRLFKWQLDQPENLDFCIEKMRKMRNIRREIEKIVVQLEALQPKPPDKDRKTEN